MAVTEAPAGARADERMRRAGLLRRLLSRPELGAVAGAIIVWIFFAVVAGDKGFLSTDGTASYLEVASELGILAVAVSLLMIAGEFDLSIGSIVGASGMAIALLNLQYNWPLWAAILAAVALSLVIGFLNGLVVTRTRLPSFIVTLASLFIFRGVTIGVTRQLTGRTQLGGLDTSKIGFVEPLFSGHIAFAACLVAIIDVVKFTSADVLRGTQQEFIAIIAVVIGGTLLTGGYGSAIGAVFGALIFGMVQQGIVITGVNADWFQVFLGGMLILAVLVNNYIRRKAAEAKR